MIDISILCFYLISTLAIGIYYGRGIKTLKDFLISEREFSNPVMLATLFATVIGAGSTCGIVSNVYQYGLLFMFAFYGASLNKFLVAKYLSHRIKMYDDAHSLGDIFAIGYGKQGRLIAGLGTLFVTVITLGQQILAIGLVFNMFFDIPLFWGIVLGFGTLVTYSAFGGIRAVVMTDVYQFIFIMAFVPIIFIATIKYIGGMDVFMAAIKTKSFLIPSDQTTLFKAGSLFFVMAFASLDPSMIQRIILAKNNKQAVYILRTTASLSIVLFTIMGLLGLALNFHDLSVAPSSALPYLIDNALPVVLRGIAISAILAVIMSTADSDLHVVSAYTVKDVIMPYFKNISDRQQTLCAKFLTVIIGIGGSVIALCFNNIFDILIFAFGFWGPCILVPFVFLVWDKKVSNKELTVVVATTQLIVVSWNLFLKDTMLIDGMIPGMVYSILAYTMLLTYKKRQQLILKPV